MNQTKSIRWTRGIFDPEGERGNPLLSWLWLGALFLIGLTLWGYFLNFGSIPFDFHDWAEVNAPRVAFLKDAVTKGQLPLHMQDASALRGVTDRYFALPDVIFSPQILLLRWLAVGDFVLIHTWLLYALGFWGMLRLKSRLNLSLFSFTWLFFLLNFNGHLTAHYAVGHITWGGTFLFPWFVLLILQLIDGETGWRWAAKMAWLLFFMFLQGSFHQFVWCLIFLGFAGLTGKKRFWAAIQAGLCTGLLSMFRLIPPALQMGSFDDDFLGGYARLRQVAFAFVRIIAPQDSLTPAMTFGKLGWWEYDLYVGFAGALFLVFFGVLWLKTRLGLRGKEKSGLGILLPMAALALFSVGAVYGVFRRLPIPLFAGERVSARFLILPFTFLSVYAVSALQGWMERQKYHPIPLIAPVVLLCVLLTELWAHLETWKVTNSVKAFPVTLTDLAAKVVGNHHDPQYTQGLLIGLAVTLATAVVLAVLSWREKRDQDKVENLTRIYQNGK